MKTIIIIFILLALIIPVAADPHTNGDHLVKFKIVTPPHKTCEMPTEFTTRWELPKIEMCSNPVQFANVTISEMEIREDQDFFSMWFNPEYITRNPISAYTAENGSVIFPMKDKIKYQITIETQTENTSFLFTTYPFADRYTIYLKTGEPE
jgi:hypothetical protein